MVLHDLRDDGRAVVASNVVGRLRELAGDGLGPQRDVRVLGAGVRRVEQLEPLREVLGLLEGFGRDLLVQGDAAAS